MAVTMGVMLSIVDPVGAAEVISRDRGIPSVKCVSPSWDFGRLANTQSVEHVFELLNEGSAPLRILQIRSGCGCTTVKTGSDQVEPRGTTQVTVTFNLAGRSGEQRKVVYVHTNDPENPILQLEMKGEALGTTGSNAGGEWPHVGVVDGTAQVFPKILSLGRVKMEATSKTMITLSGRSSNDVVTAKTVDTGTLDLTARFETSNGVCRVLLCLRPSKTLGPGSALVSIQTTHPILKTVTVPVTWQTEGDLYPIPETITLVARSNETDTVTRYVTIRSHSGAPINIGEITCDNPTVTTEIEQLAGGKGVQAQVSGITSTSGHSLTICTKDGVSLKVPIIVRSPTTTP